jgi:hypothetical protein
MKKISRINGRASGKHRGLVAVLGVVAVRSSEANRYFGQGSETGEASY